MRSAVLALWTVRWLAHQPLVWAIQLFLGLLISISIQGTPERWMQPQEVYARSLSTWLIPVMLLGVFLSWNAASRLRPIAVRLSSWGQVSLWIRTILGVLILIALPWTLAALLLLEGQHRLNALGLCFRATSIALGPALGVVLSGAEPPARIAGSLAILSCWGFSALPMTGDWHAGLTVAELAVTGLAGVLATCGFALIGLGCGETRAKPNRTPSSS